MKTNFFCPKCNMELMGHPANHCLDSWVARTLNLSDEFLELGICPQYSSLIEPGWLVMRKIWEMDPAAFISRDKIHLNSFIKNSLNLSYFTHIEGDTFPLQACRAALFLARILKERGRN